MLGDPQYKAIHLTSYQQFSYKTKHVVRRVEIVPPESTDNGSGVDVPQIGTKPQIGTEHPIEDPQCPEGYKLAKKGTCKKIIHDDNPCGKTKYKTIEIMENIKQQLLIVVDITNISPGLFSVPQCHKSI